MARLWNLPPDKIYSSRFVSQQTPSLVMRPLIRGPITRLNKPIISIVCYFSRYCQYNSEHIQIQHQHQYYKDSEWHWWLHYTENKWKRSDAYHNQWSCYSRSVHTIKYVTLLCWQLFELSPLREGRTTERLNIAWKPSSWHAHTHTHFSEFCRY